MTTLLLAEHSNGALLDHTARALAAARLLGGEVHVLVAGNGLSEVAAAAALLDGVGKVLRADAPALESRLDEDIAALILSLAGDYDAFIAASTSGGKGVMPRVAALLDVMQVSDIVGVEDGQTFRRPIYAGNAIQTLRSNDAKKVITVRTSAFSAAGEAAASAPIVDAAAPATTTRTRLVQNLEVKSGRPDLAGARIVISGGRALGSKEQFDAVLLPLADKLKAAVGASRAAVDAGYAPNDWQVGQTGKIVAPELYIAIGISGAIQHLAGMKDSRIIVAINKDADAPIFQIADYGLVGDLFTLLPEIEALL